MTLSDDAEKPDSLDALLRQAAHVSSTVPASRTLGVGTALAGGRLSILRKLGEGGMGTVYEAFDNQRKARVALKTLTRIDPASVYRLKNEFRALSDVVHPHLVRLYELFAEGDTWFFTMELIDGERLDRWLRSEGRCDQARVRKALPQILRGIAAIHAAGKLHRDLKPSNVLVTAEGRLVILDFGLAVDPELGGIGHTVAEQSVSGTPAYMAPEQAAGERATRASDHYALGVMLFEALTGRLPFEGRAGAMLAAKQRDVAPDPRSLDASAPDDLAALCVALLARDPNARPDGVALRGLMEASVQAPPDEASPWRVSAPAPALPELFGRASELAMLREGYAASLTGQAVVLFVTGESGMGKSALLDAFLAELREAGQTVVLAGRCYERENVPYKGFDALVDELSRVLRKLPLHEAAALMPREVFALARIFPVLERLQVVAEAPRREVPDPQDLKRRAFEAFGELLARMRDRGPVTIVIDDLQWIDQDSVRFMRALLTHSTPAPIMLVCAQRSEGAEANELLSSVRKAAAQNPALSVRELAVAALPHDALVALAQRLLPASMDARVSEDLARAAQGSPFFATELARAAPLRAPHEPPLALSDALALHVRSLAPEAQRLLAVLALAGQPLSPLRAIEAAELSDGHVHLDRLRTEQLVRFSFDADGERRVECYHDKIREQVSGQLDLTRARWLAQSLANALRAAGSSDCELLTRLFELADQLALAGEYAALAAERALASLAFTRAAALFELALRNGQFPEERLQALRVEHAEALASAGQGERAGAAFVAAAQGTRGDEARDLRRKAGEQYLMCGDLERGRALMAQVSRQVGLSFARSLGGALLSLVWWRLRLHFSRLRFVPRAQVDPESERELALLNTLTTGLVRTDQLRGADFCARWVLRALKAGHAVELARALAWEFLFTSMMDLSPAKLKLVEKLCEQLLAQTSDPIAEQTFSYSRGIYLLMKRGDCAAALHEFDRSLALVNQNPGPTTSYARPWVQNFRASALLGSGRVEDARTIAQGQLEDARARGDRTVSSVLTGTVVMGWLAADRPDQARALIERERLSLRQDEENLQDFYWLIIQPLADAYTGHYREAWYAAEAHRDRYLSSLTGRVLNPGGVESMACSVAVAAAQRTDEPRERRRLTRVAERLEKRARRSTYVGFPPSLAAVQCMRGDREGAIASLRQALASNPWPFVATTVRYRLGELLRNDEGRALIAEAEQAMRAGGVVNPARFVAAFMPGVELP